MTVTDKQVAVIAAIGDWIGQAKVKDALELAIHGSHFNTSECKGDGSEREEGQRRLDEYADQAVELSTQATECGMHDLARVMGAWDSALRRWHARKLYDVVVIWNRLDVRLHQELDHATPRSLAAAGRDGDHTPDEYHTHHHDLPQEIAS